MLGWPRVFAIGKQVDPRLVKQHMQALVGTSTSRAVRCQSCRRSLVLRPSVELGFWPRQRLTRSRTKRCTVKLAAGATLGELGDKLIDLA